MALDCVPTTTADAAEIWLSALRAAGRSRHTVANYRHAVDKLTAWRGDSDITTVSRFEAMRFVQHLSDNYQPGGVANRMLALEHASPGCSPSSW
jgi:site-specific recombinase XerC